MTTGLGKQQVLPVLLRHCVVHSPAQECLFWWNLSALAPYMFGLLVKTMEGREGVTRIWSSGSLRFYSWPSLNLNRPARAISALYHPATQGPLNFIQRTMYGGVSGHTSNVILETKPHHTLICLIYVHNTIDHWPIRPCIRMFSGNENGVSDCQWSTGLPGRSKEFLNWSWHCDMSKVPTQHQFFPVW